MKSIRFIYIILTLFFSSGLYAQVTADITDVSPDPRNTHAGTVNIIFSVSVTGVDITDFTLTRNAGSIDISGLSVTGSGSSYSIDLSTVTSLEGTYILTLVAAGSSIEDGSSNPLSADASDEWVMDLTAPTISSISIPNTAMKVNDVVTATITVTSDVEDYTSTGSIGGTIGGFTVTNFSKNSDTEYTVQFTIAEGGTDVAAGSDIPVSISITDEAGNISTTYNTAISQANDPIDANTPVVNSVGVPAEGTYVAGQTLDLTVNWSEAVTVNTTGGTPTIDIMLETGGAVQASYASGSGSTATVFSYTVKTGDEDTDGIGVGSTIALNSGTIQDGAGNNANTGLNSIGTTTGVLVDAIDPTILSVTMPGNATYSINENIDLYLNTSESVTLNTASGTPYVVYTIGTTPGAVNATYNAANSTASSLLFRYNVQLNDFDNNGIDIAGTITLNNATIKDAAGNDLVLTFTPGQTNQIKVDAEQPAVQSVTVPADGYYIETQTLDFVATFDKAVDITGTPRIPITLSSGTVYANYSAGTGTTAITFTYTVAANDLDVVGGITLSTDIDLNGGTIKEKNNNASTSLIGVNPLPSTTGILIDAVLPTITSFTLPTDGYYVESDNLDFIANYDKVVYVSGSPYISITLNTGGIVQAGYIGGTGTSSLTFRYTVVSGNLDDTDGITVANTITLNSGTIKDNALNDGDIDYTDVLGDPSGILVDAVLPTLTSVGIVSDNLNSSGTYAKEGDQITLSFTGSETLTSKPTVTIAGNAIASGSVTNPSGDNWQAVYTMGALDAEGIVPFTIDFTDQAGNTNSTVTTTTNLSSVTYYRSKPTLATVSIASNHTNPDKANVGDLITVTFSSARELDNVTATIMGNAATVNNVGDLYNWTATYTTQSGDLEGQIPFTINFTDMPENAGDPVSAATDGSSVVFDKTPPQLNSVTIESDNTNSAYVGNGGTVMLSITGSEGLEDSPVVTINSHAATVSKVAGSSINWRASYVMGSAGGDAEGPVTFTVDFVDFSGNSGLQVTDITGTTDGSSVTLDKTPPSLPTVSIVSDNSNNTSFAKPGDVATVTFTSSEDIESVTATIGLKVAAVSSTTPTSWTAEYTLPTTGVSEGVLPISIVFKDYAGNLVTHSTGTTNGSSVTFDKTPPGAPTDLVLTTDYGSSTTDNITSEVNPGFFGTAEAFSTIYLYSNKNGSTPIGTVTASDTSTFEITSTSVALAEGNHIITATATDGPGNVSSISESLTITIDNTPPAKPGTPDMDAGSDTGILDDDNITSDNTPTLAGISETNCRISVYSGATLLGIADADIFGVWSYTTPVLAEGVHSITVFSTDPAGNVSKSASEILELTIDTSAPAAPGAPDLTDGSDSGVSNSDNITNDATPTFTGTAEVGAAIQLYSDLEGLIGSGTADVDGNWTITSGSLLSATHAITVVATDRAGNVSPSSPELNVTIDTDSPSQPVPPVLDQLSDTGASDTDGITNISMPKINGLAEADAYVDIYLDNTLIATETTDPAGKYAYTFGALTDGNHSIRVVCKDPAGNASVTSNNLLITIDTALPAFSSVTLASNNARTYLARAGNKVTLSFNTSESVQQPTVDIDGKSVAITGGPTVWTATRTLDGTETEGSLDFSIEYADIAGNAGAIQTSTTDASEVLFDRTAPDLTSIGIASDHSNPDKARVGSEINIVFTCTETIENVSVKINGKVAPVDTISADNWKATGYLASNDPEGAVAFTIDYKDLAGNAGVQDTATTDASAVTFDKTTPSYNLVSIYSDNSNPAFAVDGDQVTLEFVTSETVETPGIFINGLAPDAITGGPVSWLAIRTVATGENEGAIPFTINISDLAGNTPTAKFTTTDGTAVVFDDSNPGISSVTVTAGVYKVGDVIPLLIRSDDVTYTGTTVEVNGKPQVLVNNMNNNYTIDYLVEEGDTELDRAGSIPVNIVLQDPAGLTSSRTEATSIGGTITIDSHTPLINAFSSNAEDSGNLIIGDSIIFALMPVTAETGLNIQPVSYNGAVLNWETTDGAIYTAIYKVQENDPERTSPLQLSQVILSDDAGNADTAVYAGIDKQIYTKYPSARITGSTSKCDYGQTVPIIFQLTGRKPFTFSYSNGTDTIGPIVHDGFTYTINEDKGEFTLVSLTDSTGNYVADAVENATIDVVPLPVVTTDYFNSPYNIESPADELSQYVVQEAKRNGIFSAAEGIGYSSGAYYIYPGNIPADLLDKDIQIIYTYTDGTTGCFTKDTSTVFISSTPVRIVGLQSVYCKDKEPVTIGGNLPAQHTGRFDVFDVEANLVTTGWVQTDSVTLTLDPQQLPAGDYTMKYTAIKLPEYAETSFSSTREFSIEAIRTGIQITGLSDEYCFDSFSPSLPVRINFEPGPGDIGNYFGSDVFTVIPRAHTARFELGDARADSVYTLSYIYESVHGCVADTVSRTIRINPLPELAFELDNNYNYDQSSIQLSGTPDDPKYNFSGEGVSNNTLFTSAARINSDIVITFAGSDDKGCYNEVIDTTIIYRANETIEGIRADGVYCYEERVLDISCTPNISDTITGTFRSMRNALEPDGKNKARYYFNRIGSGADTVIFDYDVLGTSYTVKKAVFIDSIGEVSITSSTADFDYCHSESLVQLIGNQNYTLGGQGEFEYVGSSGEAVITRSSSTSIYPMNEVPGTYSIKYSYASSRGCSAETSHVINIYPEPVTDFSQPISCPDLTTPILFTNLTKFSGDESELSWEWRFEGGLPVTEKNPVYTFQSNGVKQVTLKATTDKGCAVSKSREYTIGNIAQADFRWDNECNTGEQVTLTSTSSGGVPEYATYTWKVEGAVIPGDRSAVHQFTDIGEYDIRLLYTSDAGCTDSVTKTIVIQPYIRITEDFADHTYIEDFESGNEFYIWQTRGLTKTDTTRWNLGVPDGDVINIAASGNHSWYTKLADRTDVENSEVVSPCFDLSGLEKPMIKLNIWSSSEFKRDGAVMQYSIDYGNTWTNLGDVNEGVNWFNSENIQSQPGGSTQFVGWNVVRMGEWRSARHSLDFLKDEAIVRFRIAYAADGGGVDDVDGFAFDDVWIGERQQNVLTEYFTNNNVIGSVEGDANMVAYEASRNADLIPIHYHTGSPAGDPLFSDYEEGPSARQFYYGVSTVPEVISNGFIRSAIDNETVHLFEQKIDVESLRDPLVSIDLNVSPGSAEVTITALGDLAGESMVLFGAVVKDSVEVDGVYYYNVLRKFLPDPAGIILTTDGFTNGVSITESLPVSLVNSSMFIGSRLVVFVQNTNSKYVYQSVRSDLSGLTSLAPGSIGDMVDIYPNPAVERLFIDSEYEIRRLVITDMTGRVVRIMEPDQNKVVMSLDGYNYGIYIIKGITDHGEFIKKFIKK